MILADLVKLYDDLAAREDSGVPPVGYTTEKVSFALVIDPDGNLVDVEDLRDHSGKKPQPVPMVVPEHPKRTVGVAPAFLCDNSSYLLGCDSKGKPARAVKCLEAAGELHSNAVAASPNAGEDLNAVSRFLRRWDPGHIAQVPYHDEIVQGANLVFRIKGRHGFVHDGSNAARTWSAMVDATQEDDPGVCLVTGTRGPVARLHPSIKGIRGGQSSGVSIVSYNFDAACSFGKKQGENGPVSEQAAQKYVAALNYLTTARKHHIDLAGATTVFWAEQTSPFEDVFFGTLDIAGLDDESTQELGRALKRVRDGLSIADVDEQGVFTVVGLSPNAGRLWVRFWMRDRIAVFRQRLAEHLGDCRIEKQWPNQPDVLSVRNLLAESATRYGDSGKPNYGDVNPRMMEGMARALLTGGQYPPTMLQTYLGRIRADGSVNYPRVSAIRAALTRHRRLKGEQEVPVSLQDDYPSVGYQLGRLFAALERAQTSALGEINTTIKDRYFGAASTTPARVFPVLMRLAQHHIAKAEWGRSVDRRIAEIVDRVGDFPRFLPLEEQGAFAIGYYHQRNDFYRSKGANDAPQEEETHG